MLFFEGNSRAVGKVATKSGTKFGSVRNFAYLCTRLLSQIVFENLIYLTHPNYNLSIFMQENLLSVVPAQEVGTANIAAAEGGNVEAAKVAVSNLTMIEEFMATGYEFRRNVLADKYEMCECRAAEGSSAGDASSTPGQKTFRPVTREAINSIVRRLKREFDEDSHYKAAVEEYIYSEETPEFNPIVEYLEQLPAWDGRDRVSELFHRLPGVSDEQVEWLRVWLRSCVAHWLGMDKLHGNESIVTLIGAQGSGKSTFCAQILPPMFRSYYLDHVNLGNKFDKEMALTNNLLVNIDELDQIKRGKQPELKQLVSKIQVNGRPIFGREQRNRPRFASFVATTNNPRPLQDPTGSRRYLCVEIPRDSIICNDRPIDYPQLYAQVMYEVREQSLRYWFTPGEVRQIEEHNVRYQHTGDLETMLTACFRRPEANEVVKPMLTREVVSVLARNYPEVKQTQGMNIKVGRMLKAMSFTRKEIEQGTAYFIVPVAA